MHPRGDELWIVRCRLRLRRRRPFSAWPTLRPEVLVAFQLTPSAGDNMLYRLVKSIEGETI